MMPRFWIPIILLLFSICADATAATVPAPKDEIFQQFYADFQKAVKAGDKEKVVNMTDFDGFNWEASASLQKVRTREAFLKNYTNMFTSMIKNKIATAKPDRTEEGSYFIIWTTKTSEYSLYFNTDKDGNYKFKGLTIGPNY